MNLSKREMIIGGSYLVFLAVSGIYFFLFRGIFGRFKSVQDEINAAEEALVKLHGIVADTAAIEQKYEEYRRKLVTYDPGEASTTEILKEIKAKAASADLNVVNIKPFSLKNEGSFTAFDLRLETEGELRHIGSFLYELDDAPYLFTLRFIQINAQTQTAVLKTQMLLSAVLNRE